MTEKCWQNKRKCVQDCRKASHVVQTRFSGNDKNTENRVRIGINVHEIFVSYNEAHRRRKWGGGAGGRPPPLPIQKVGGGGQNAFCPPPPPQKKKGEEGERKKYNI